MAPAAVSAALLRFNDGSPHESQSHGVPPGRGGGAAVRHFDISRCSSKCARRPRPPASFDGGASSRGSTGVGLGRRISLAFTLAQTSPARDCAHLPPCTHRCRPETRDGLSTSRPRRSGIAGCRAALRSGQSLKLSFEGKRVPARRARSPALGRRGSKRWQLRSHAEHEGLGSGWPTDRTVAAHRSRPRAAESQHAVAATAADAERKHAVAQTLTVFIHAGSSQIDRQIDRRTYIDADNHVGGQSTAIRQGRRHGL